MNCRFKQITPILCLGTVIALSHCTSNRGNVSNSTLNGSPTTGSAVSSATDTYKVSTINVEADGTGGSKHRNAGPIYKIKKADADRLNQELEQLSLKNENLIRNKLKALTQTDSSINSGKADSHSPLSLCAPPCRRRMRSWTGIGCGRAAW